MPGEILRQAVKMNLLGAVDAYPRFFLFTFQTPDKGFGLPDRQSPGDNRPPGSQLLGGGFGAQQGPGMSHAQCAFSDAVLDLVRQLTQPQEIGHCRSAFAHPGSRLVLGQVELSNQPVIGISFFNGVEILPLDVFHQGYFQQFVVPYLFDDHRNLGQPGASG